MWPQKVWATEDALTPAVSPCPLALHRLLHDYVAVCTQTPAVHASYRLRLVQPPPEAAAPVAPAAAAGGESAAEAGAAEEATAAATATAAAATVGPTPAAVMDAVRPALLRAWPTVLDAAASVLGEAPAAAQDAAAQEQHAALLDVSQMALSRAAEVAGGSSEWRDAGLAQLAAALAALRQLTAPQFAAAGWLAPGEVAELASQLQQLLQAVLLPLAAGGHLAPGQAASLAEAAASVLRQVPASAGVQQQVVAAASACLQLASIDGSSSGSAPTADALAAVSQQLQVLCSADTFVPCLQQALQLGVEVAGSSQQQDQLAAAATFLAEAAAAAATWQEHQQQPGVPPSSTGAAGLPLVESVVAAALHALAQHAERSLGSNGSSNGGVEARSKQLEAVLGGMLALAGALPSAASPDMALPVAGAAAVAAPADGFGDDDWGEDPFGDTGAAAAPGQAAAAAPDTDAAEPQPTSEVPDDDPFAEAAAPLAAEQGGLAGLSLADSGSAAAESAAVAAAGRQLVLDVLATAAGSKDATAQVSALTALCAFLQQQQQQQPWALQCAAAELPGAAARVHALMSGGSSLDEADTQVCGWGRGRSVRTLQQLPAASCPALIPSPASPLLTGGRQDPDRGPAGRQPVCSCGRGSAGGAAAPAGAAAD